MGGKPAGAGGCRSCHPALVSSRAQALPPDGSNDQSNQNGQDGFHPLSVLLDQEVPGSQADGDNRKTEKQVRDEMGGRARVGVGLGHDGVVSRRGSSREASERHDSQLTKDAR